MMKKIVGLTVATALNSLIAGTAFAEPEKAIEEGIDLATIELEAAQELIKEERGGFRDFFRGLYIEYLASGGEELAEKAKSLDIENNRVEIQLGPADTQEHRDINDWIKRCMTTAGGC